MWDNTSAGHHRLPNETPALGMGCIFLSHWPTVSHRSQAVQVIVSGIGYPPQPDAETLMLKISLTSIIGHGEIELVLIWKLYLHWLVSERSNHHFHPALNPASYIKDLAARWCIFMLIFFESTES